MISFMPNTIEDTLFLTKLWHENALQKRKLADDQSEFTQSYIFQSQNSRFEREGKVGKEDFTRSVHVVSTGKGHYKVYHPPSSSHHHHQKNNDYAQSSLHGKDTNTGSDMESFSYHISNPGIRKLRQKSSDTKSVISVPAAFFSRSDTESFSYKKKPNGLLPSKVKSRSLTSLHSEEELSRICNCKSFHSHKFAEPQFFLVPDKENLWNFEESLSKRRQDLIEANEKHLLICNIFWRPSLSMHQFVHGKSAVLFTSLWQEEASLKDLLKDSVQNTVLRSSISDLTLLAVAAGPLHLLKSLIDLALVRVDIILDDGAGLLHHACLFRRPEIIQYLTGEGIPPNLKDKQGNTADQFCFCPKTWKSLPTKYHAQTSSTSRSRAGQPLQPSIQDKDVIFRMAESAVALYELQKKLQLFEFNVNTECNGNGDFLIHVAARGGLCQLPLIMLLLRIQTADVELCNSKGMTPLMIAAQEGNTILCDLLICLFQASPNKSNVHNGKCALHYASQNNHLDTVSCLIRRGADFNKEDYNGTRPDDPCSSGLPVDCLNIITVHREQRCQQLTQLCQEGRLPRQALFDSDLNVTDENGFTLLMVAALRNRFECMKMILDIDGGVVDAQYVKPYGVQTDMVTGMTAMAMAAYQGHERCIRLLLQRAGKPSIGDINRNIPIHHAVLQNNQEAVRAILDFFPKTFVGLYQALKLCKNTDIVKMLKEAWQRRQDELVLPDLLECAMSGKAESLYCLLEEGDNLNSQSGVGNWPLYLAAEYGHLDVVKLFCERGAELKRKHMSTGNTALHVAAQMGHQGVVAYLLKLINSRKHSNEKNSRDVLDINAVNFENKTPLQLAAEKGKMKLVKLLLNYGATTALLDQNGVLFSVPEYGGVWSEIESQRQKHMNLVMKLIKTKSKKSLQELVKAWEPRYDHNLRDRNGDTPLMVACFHSNVEAVTLLLQSAVYRLHGDDQPDSVSEMKSDAESGILDSATCYNNSPNDSDPEEPEIQSLLQTLPGSSIMGQSLNGKNWYDENRPRPLETLLNDVEKPKGLSIYHYGMVSHVTAVNLFDASTPLHKCLEGGDNPVIVDKLLKADVSCVNMQNSAGLSPVHLACQQNRKKSLEKILLVGELDINLYTLIGQLPEEMTNNKSVIKMVQKARKGQPVRQKSSPSRGSVASSLPDSEAYVRPPSTKGSSINLEKVHERFEAFKSKLTKKEDKV